jgi:hypothetical protein
MVVIAIMAVVLLGLTAFAIDAGAMYTERRELQSAADAAVLAVAEDCALGDIPCNSSFASNTAQVYANDNAPDGASKVQSLDLDTTAQTVSATVISENAETGSTVLAPFFAQVLGFEGSTVGATATAEWGFPGGTRGFPIIVSECEWQGVGVLEEPPFSGSPTVFYIHDGNSAGTCEHGGAGQDLPGGFGWLDASLCETFTQAGSPAPADPGASPSTGCTAQLLKDKFHNKPVLLPYFDDLDSVGNTATYDVHDYGAFWITGYYFGGQYKEQDLVTGQMPCGGDQRCFSGFPTTMEIYDGDLGGGTDRGVILIKLTN